ncbi:MAG: carbohydrate binding domain-containing protein [Clostridia bacterium]|nr:carbohydrate binding domain-containing protein [Clostridia bacterium]
MKYSIVSLFRKVIAAAVSLIMTVFGFVFPDKAAPSGPEANSVTAYDVSAADYNIDINASKEVYDISDLLFGIFFEDINFAADGGLYAEKVVNRSFEFTELAKDDQLYGWSAVNGAALSVIKNAADKLNENNPNYLVIDNSGSIFAGAANRGFLDGMSVEKGEKYNISFYAKGLDGYQGKVYARILNGGNVLGEGEIASVGGEWKKYELSLTVSETAFENVSLAVMIDGGSAAFDMISMFPENTFKNRENGMRKDLGEMLEALEPKFLRFPGGCIIEGYDAETAYNWKDSIGTGSDGKPLEFDGVYGDIAARKQGTNLWTNIAATDDPYPSFMTYGLGFYEYFQLAEDLGALGVPVINCGLYCQMRGKGPVDMYTPEFEQYLQDMLDLVEFCRGDAESEWGKVRASLGHEEPFELKYICIGNENEGEVYFERYQAFLETFNEAKAENPELYEGIELIYSSGAFDATHGENYLPSYEYAKEQIGNGNAADFAGATDQHYYNEPEWFLRNADYYDADNYSRDVDGMTETIYGGGLSVFLGEYAARSNTLRAALAEAAYMTGLERNGDIVRMAAYAPLFGNLTATHWSPDLIWFNNHQVTGSISYYVQKLFSNNTGTKLLDSKLSGAAVEQKDLSGRVGIGAWYTTAAFDNVLVTDNATGKTLYKDSFGINDFAWNWNEANAGEITVDGGRLINDATSMPYTNTGSVAYTGFDEWENYTYTVEATKINGSEGFIIPFAVKDSDNCWFWNIGGWDNTVSCLQQIENGIKSGRIIGTVKPFTAEEGKTYSLKVELIGTVVRCYIDGELYVDFDTGSPAEAEAYHVVSTDETGDVIVKIVNVTGSSKTLSVNVMNADIASAADVEQLRGESLGDDNILGQPEDCKVETFEVNGMSSSFNYTVPAYSVTVIRLHKA